MQTPTPGRVHSVTAVHICESTDSLEASPACAVEAVHPVSAEVAARPIADPDAATAAPLLHASAQLHPRPGSNDVVTQPFAGNTVDATAHGGRVAVPSTVKPAEAEKATSTGGAARAAGLAGVQGTGGSVEGVGGTLDTHQSGQTVTSCSAGAQAGDGERRGVTFSGAHSPSTGVGTQSSMLRVRTSCLGAEGFDAGEVFSCPKKPSPYRLLASVSPRLVHFAQVLLRAVGTYPRADGRSVAWRRARRRRGHAGAVHMLQFGSSSICGSSIRSSSVHGTSVYGSSAHGSSVRGFCARGSSHAAAQLQYAPTASLHAGVRFRIPPSSSSRSSVLGFRTVFPHFRTIFPCFRTRRQWRAGSLAEARTWPRVRT
eukprot:6209159-Pleurochrysis_carterae.AAC.1